MTEIRGNGDHERLVAALGAALASWEEWKHGKSLLGQYPPSGDVVAPLVDAIQECRAFKLVEGSALFSGNSGVVLHAPSLAPQLLYRAERANSSDAASWFLRLLAMQEADGTFIAALWGLSVGQPVQLTETMSLIPFDNLADRQMKQRILDTAREEYDHVWISQRYFGRPGAALVKKVSGFPYIGALDQSVQILERLTDDIKGPLHFLQANATGQPLAVATWFEYEDVELDLNDHENYLSWFLPEVIPHISEHVAVDAVALKTDVEALWSLPAELQSKLLRSMERFILSQCRRQIGDRAIDLMIAFETAVSGGKGENTPVNWKVGVRAAQLIGGTLARRKQVRATLSSLSRPRNEIVHGGSSRDADQQKLEQTLTESASIYRALLASFLSLGAEPDWSSLELEPRTRD